MRHAFACSSLSRCVHERLCIYLSLSLMCRRPHVNLSRSLVCTRVHVFTSSWVYARVYKVECSTLSCVLVCTRSVVHTSLSSIHHVLCGHLFASVMCVRVYLPGHWATYPFLSQVASVHVCIICVHLLIFLVLPSLDQL